jgi:hypothetical protein
MPRVRAQDNEDVSTLNRAGEAVNALGQLTAVIRSGAHFDAERAHLSERRPRAASMLSTWLAPSRKAAVIDKPEP